MIMDITEKPSKPIHSVYTVVIAAVLYGVIAVLAYLTAAFGGVEPHSLLVLRLFSILAVCSLLLIGLKTNMYVRIWEARFIWPLALFILFLLYLFLQTFIGTNIIQNGYFGSIHVYSTKNGFFDFIHYFLFFLICLKIVSHRKRLEKIAVFVSLAAFLVTVFGIFQQYAGLKGIYGRFETFEGLYFGPFIYSNNYGAYIGLVFPMMIAFAAYKYIQTREDWMSAGDSKTQTSFFISFISSGSFFIFFISILTLVGTYFSQARASAIILTFLSFYTFLVTGLLKKSNLLYAFMIFFALVAFVLFGPMNASSIFIHFEVLNMIKALDWRLSIYEDTVRLILENPWFGSGFGTYAFNSHQYLTRILEGRQFLTPNNFYLELLSGVGIFGFILLIGSFLILLFQGIRRLAYQGSRFARMMGYQALASIILFSFMLGFDTHTLLPLLNLLFLLQLAIFIQMGNKKIDNNVSQKTKLNAYKITLTIVFVALLIPLSIFDIRQYKTSISTSYQNTIETIENKLELDSTNSRLWIDKARAHYYALEKEIDVVQKKQHVRQIISSLRNTVELAPTYGLYHFLLGKYEYLLGGPAEGLKHLEKANVLSPSDREYAIYLASVYLSERDRVISGSKKNEYLNKAEDVIIDTKQFKRMGKNAFKQWMINDNPEHLKLLMGM